MPYKKKVPRKVTPNTPETTLPLVKSFEELDRLAEEMDANGQMPDWQEMVDALEWAKAQVRRQLKKKGRAPE
jgi:hypothetical protein